ncbi:hypothetical protein DMI69_24310 [Escherichia coli]|nr:hypothetical protein [Escherichia coli]
MLKLNIFNIPQLTHADNIDIDFFMEAMTCIYMMRCIYIVDIWAIVGKIKKSDSAILKYLLRFMHCNLI